jgi:serine-type D-Ala-D-Ala carboxypeptidase (penicillin-binding protein 5/6)
VTPRSPSTRAAARLALALLISLVAVGPAPAAGAADKRAKPPSLDARAWLLVDAHSGEELAGSAATRRLPIASTTKLMTAYLALADLPLDRRIAAPAYSPAPAESVLGLSEGERISVRDLLVAMLLPSANDAAYALADAVSGSVPRFVKRMNGAAAKLGLDRTSYTNPIGLDQRRNASTARDLAALALILREDPRFRRIVGKSEARLKSGATPRVVETRNTLLMADDSVDGIKTGHTLNAGYVLVASAERKGVPLVSVVLGAESESGRDAASEALLDYGFSLYSKREVVSRDEVVGTAPVANEQQPLELLAARDERVALRADQEVRIETAVEPGLEGPIAAGAPVGRGVLRTAAGDRLGSVRLLAGREIAAPGALSALGGPAAALLIAAGLILVGGAFAIAIRHRRDGRERKTGERTPEDRLDSRRRRMRQREEETRQ